MSIRGEITANNVVCEQTNDNLNTLSERIARFSRESAKRILVGGAGLIAAVGVLAGCGSDKGSATGEKHELRYASSCADVSDSEGARVYRLPGYGTFEQAVNNGVIKDTDNVTPVTQFTDIQRAQLITSFGKMNDMYNPIFAPMNGSGRLHDLSITISGDSTSGNSSEASDGKLVGDACVMYGDNSQWTTIREQGESNYVNGEPSRLLSKDYVPGQN